jgi:adenosine/AMP kinase
MVNLHAVRLTFPEGSNIILGQSHFIKTVEDVYEALVNTVPGIQFGVAFNEASGPCLTRSDGTNQQFRDAAVAITTAIGAGHIFAVVLGNAFPINVLKRVQEVPEVCSIFCATANPVEVIVAETEQGRGILGVIDGSSPKGVESETDIADRHGLLRKFGYKR